MINNSIEISIIIINYNSEKLTLNCIDSILDHTVGINYEIIIFDNYSTNQNELLKYFQGHNIKFIPSFKNIGFGPANNEAIGSASGKYLLLLNNDTLLLNNVIKEVYDYAVAFESDNFLLGVQLLNLDMSKQESVVKFPTPLYTLFESLFLYKLFPKSKIINKYFQNFYDYEEPLEVDIVKGAFMFLPKKLFSDIGGFDPRFFFYNEETDLCIRLKKERNTKIILLPQKKLIHLGGGSTSNNLRFKLKQQNIAKLQYYLKHSTGVKKFLIICFHYLGIVLRILLSFIKGILFFNKYELMKAYCFFYSLLFFPRTIR